jgi:hypothetical protein
VEGRRGEKLREGCKSIGIVLKSELNQTIDSTLTITVCPAGAPVAGNRRGRGCLGQEHGLVYRGPRFPPDRCQLPQTAVLSNEMRSFSKQMATRVEMTASREILRETQGTDIVSIVGSESTKRLRRLHSDGESSVESSTCDGAIPRWPVKKGSQGHLVGLKADGFLAYSIQ